MNTAKLLPGTDYYEQIYLLLMQTAHFYARNIYDRYLDSGLDPFRVSFEEFWRTFEGRKEVLFSSLGSEVRRAVILASKDQFDDEAYQTFVREVERETWNYIYGYFVKPKK